MADLFTLSPNPAQELVELKIEHQIMEPLTCEIYSSNGILISTHDITESRVFINTENMIDGIYIVSLYEQNKMVGMSKLIIQKN